MRLIPDPFAEPSQAPFDPASARAVWAAADARSRRDEATLHVWRAGLSGVVLLGLIVLAALLAGGAR